MSLIEGLLFYAAGSLVSAMIFAFVLALYDESDDGTGSAGLGALWPFTIPMLVMFLLSKAFVKFVSLPKALGAQARKMWGVK